MKSPTTILKWSLSTGSIYHSVKTNVKNYISVKITPTENNWPDYRSEGRSEVFL